MYAFNLILDELVKKIPFFFFQGHGRTRKIPNDHHSLLQGCYGREFFND